MFKHLSLQARLLFTVGILFVLGTVALSVLLITIQTQNATQKFEARYTRLTEMMAAAAASGVHLKLGPVIGKKLESYISSEHLLTSLLVVAAPEKTLYQFASEELPPFDLPTFLEEHPKILQNKEKFVAIEQDHLVIVEPAILAGQTVSGFMAVAWSTHTLLEERRETVLLAVAGLGIIVLVILLILAFVIGKATQRFTEFIAILKGFAKGESDFSKRLIIRSQDEIGQMAYWFNQMLSNLEATNEKQQWVISGQAGVHERLQGEQELTVILQQTLNYLAEFLQAQVGVFYLMTENRLKLMSSYAYKVRQANFNEFQLGEGLVGQAALEKKTLLFHNPPQEHVELIINTGLHELHPETIVVLPLVHQEQVMGVLELGTTGSFSEATVEFLENVAESIAIRLYSAQSRKRLQTLLVETQEQSQKLQSQQEELRISNEELEEQAQTLRESESRLQTQQEEIRVSNEELASQTKALEVEQAHTQAKNLALEATQKELQEKAQALELSNTYKSDFLANMSHELRTPLNSLLLLAESLAANKTGNLTEKQIQFAETIHGSGKELLELINEILDLSKIEAGKLEIISEHYPLHELKDYMERNFQQVADHKEVALQITVEAGLPATIYTDCQRLEQILKNFMSNAFKFTAAGKVALRIHQPSAQQCLETPGFSPETALAFSVTDSGIGISKDRQQLIFEAFQQADGSTSRKFGGTGLGLSISTELTKLLGGKILIESEEGQGSTFTLCLPLREGEHPPAEASPAWEPSSAPASLPSFSKNFSEEQAPASPQDRVLLLIEDDPAFRKIVTDLAEEKGFRVVAAANGEEGLQQAFAQPPSAIILDVGLPQIDGWGVMAQLKASPQTRDIPVHFISALDRDMKAMEMGAMGFLRKPVSQESLQKALEKIENTISQTHHHILLVEDDEAQKVVMEELMSDLNVELTQVSTGKAAHDLLKEKPFDCVVLDLGLEDISGEEWLEQVHQDQSVNLPPVIVYTSKDLSHQDEKLLEQYAETIIIKGAKSMDRLMGELNLFLHRVETLPSVVKPGSASEIQDDEGFFEGKIVLLADDDSRSSFALSHYLEEQGLVVRQAFDGKEALEILDADPHVDIVLTDIMMPEMDGYETTQAIRRQERFKNLPIIALTAKAMKHDRQKCLEAGANDYLSKPVDVEKLLSLMRVWLNDT